MTTTEKRKADHLRVCIEKNVEVGTTFLENVILVHKATPDIDFNEIDTSVDFFGKKLSMPLMIAAITGGTPEAKEINKKLAEVAEGKKIAMGLGSQKAMIEKPELVETYYVRDVAPSILLFGNIGLQKIKKYASKIDAALDAIKADGLCVHLNSAQEFFQKEEEKELCFSNSLLNLKEYCKKSRKPVIAKEVGNGISQEAAFTLKKTGISAIDIGGFGGTSWIVVDSLRSGKNVELFKNWGIPTACSILETRKVGLPIIATGGIRSGLDIAKSIALGVSITGIALPMLRALYGFEFDKNIEAQKNILMVTLTKKSQKQDTKNLEAYIDRLQYELKTAMFLTGSKNIKELKKAKYVLTGKVFEWALQRNLF